MNITIQNNRDCKNSTPDDPRRRRLRIMLRVLNIAMCLTALVIVCQSYWRSEAAKTECQNNLVQIGLTLLNYETSRGRFPSGNNQWSWIANSIPYIEANAPSFPNLSKSWDDPSNRFMRQFDRETGNSDEVHGDDWGVFLCPSASLRSNKAGYGLTSFVGIGGLGRDAPTLTPDNPRAGLFGYREGTRTDQIKDGMATTMAVTETARENGPWRAPGSSTIRGLDRDHQPYIGKGGQFGGLHREGAMVLFADGSVRFVSEKVNARVLEAMSTIAGGERVATDPHIVNP